MTSVLSEPLAAVVIVLDESGRATLTEIAKVADMPVSTVQRAVQTLEADELVRREGHRGPIVFRPAAPRAALRQIADWSFGRRRSGELAIAARQLAQQQPSVPSTIRDPAIRAAWPATIEAIVRQFAPKRVILFGSQARRDVARDSDVDLLVIFEELRNRLELRWRIKRRFPDLARLSRYAAESRYPDDIEPVTPIQSATTVRQAAAIVRAIREDFGRSGVPTATLTPR